ncbi:hypothetical protein ACWDWT_43975 [Streptomyces sp. NPDC003343]
MSHGEDQALAVTLAALLLVGGTLVARELVGVWVAAGLGMGPVLAAYWGPPLARRIAIAREVRRFGRHIEALERATR